MIVTPLIEIPEFRDIISECKNLFHEKKITISKENRVESSLALPSSWRYSRGDYFYPLPYRNEIMGYQPAKIIKRQYQSTDEASNKGIHSSGFLEGKHIVTRHPIELDTVIDISLFEYNINEILHLNLRGFRRNSRQKEDSLKSIGKTFTRDDKIINVNYARDGNFLVNLLRKDEKQNIFEEYIYTKEWDTNDIYKYIHDEQNQLLEVRAPGKSGNFDVVIWKRDK
ncbi:hypothetical protein AVHY2522_15155 [Acidovorax sp. SUPP2522]|uniref:hypothetical protein n=1 Tax=unclassified Acidovorax TaxID=2684926 RepID=UPI00234AA10F|nr:MULTISPECIES: hypothetical protein [unclassified Acidovorax]WCM96124.1 hypothetical protein M5C96_16935 [Acidovorax sp. GBBC 1281]GKT17416.1 hypothetical protein AVHY2522_15155 [Acidovorax sp. SUPP2522]